MIKKIVHVFDATLGKLDCQPLTSQAKLQQTTLLFSLLLSFEEENKA